MKEMLRRQATGELIDDEAVVQAKDQSDKSSTPTPNNSEEKSFVSIFLKDGQIYKVITLFTVATLLLILILFNLPPMKEEDRELVVLPKNLKDVRNLSNILSKYSHEYYYQMMFTISCIYLFLLTFSVPGTIFLNVLCGAMFGLYIALPLTLIAGVMGATCAYLLSELFGKSIIINLFPSKLEFFKMEVQKQKGNLFFFMLFLRISPLLPNWFINIASPIVGVPYWIFFLATLVGIAPQTIIAVNTGVSISEITQLDEKNMGNPLLNIKNIILLFSIAFMALLPVLLKKIVASWHVSKDDK